MSAPRLSGLFIDCPEATFDDGVRFWAGAFAIEPVQADSPEYVSLPGAIPGMVVEVQRVADAARYHIDFPAADVEAEVAYGGPRCGPRRPGGDMVGHAGAHRPPVLCSTGRLISPPF